MTPKALLVAFGAMALLLDPGLARAADDAADDPAGPSAPAALPVHVVTVATTPRTRDFHLTGTIAAKDSYSAGFRDGGRVISVNVDVGDVLRAGDEIAQVDPAQTDASLRAAQASLDAAAAALVQAEQARDRASGLLKRGSGTQSDLESATETYLKAKASRDQAQAQLASAKRASEDTVLRAVEDAVVTDRSAEPGQVVGAGQAIVTLANSAGREAVFLTPDLPDLNEFLSQPIRLTPLEGGDEIVVPVSEISPVVSENGTVTAKAAIEGDAARTFTIGEPVIGELTIEGDPVISVPWTALTAQDAGPAVWIVREGDLHAELRQVTIAAYSSDKVEISEGLTDGDIVVTDGAQSLFPGRSVIIKEAGQ
ncbi:efflux RND transporter periplasmic adaptor subunit [Pseudooceanicola sediminis]|mgnify:CR=1 FL=1|nr:efflux RND transporter periplasmic adaptor subunit [Pseudooceanicola sediminis]